MGQGRRRGLRDQGDRRRPLGPRRVRHAGLPERAATFSTPTGGSTPQDAVEQDGEWLRFLGRTTDIINVGGQKVYPAEVESVLLEMDNVQDVAVRGEPNPLIGRCVVARVKLRQPELPLEFKARMRRHCLGLLAPYMVPVKVELADGELHNARGKRVRKE